MPEDTLRTDRERLMTNIRIAATVRRARPVKYREEGIEKNIQVRELTYCWTRMMIGDRDDRGWILVRKEETARWGQHFVLGEQRTTIQPRAKITLLRRARYSSERTL